MTTEWADLIEADRGVGPSLRWLGIAGATGLIGSRTILESLTSEERIALDEIVGMLNIARGSEKGRLMSALLIGLAIGRKEGHYDVPTPLDN